MWADITYLQVKLNIQWTDIYNKEFNYMQDMMETGCILA